MAAPVGHDRDAVIDAAVAVLDSEGRIERVTLRPVADRLGVRVQSLYAHVDGVEGLRRAVALRGLAELTDRLDRAAAERSGGPAIEAIVRAHCAFALERPGLFDATLRPPGDDPELRAAMDAVMAPLDRVLGDHGLDAETQRHWYRVIFSAVYGYATLRGDGRMTLDADPDDTLDLLVEVLVTSLDMSTASGTASGATGTDP